MQVPLLIAAVCVCALADKLSASSHKKPLALTGDKPRVGGACNKACGGDLCEYQLCQACVPPAPSCKTTKCEPYEKCTDTPVGPRCDRLTCEDIYCAAGTICNGDLPGGPDCVPDVPSCEGFFCRRGTNCYVREGSPICLPNTCEVRVCAHKLTCIDTPAGALCRRGMKKKGCSGKYCPTNSRCEDTKEKGAHCAKI